MYLAVYFIMTKRENICVSTTFITMLQGRNKALVARTYLGSRKLKKMYLYYCVIKSKYLCYKYLIQYFLHFRVLSHDFTCIGKIYCVLFYIYCIVKATVCFVIKRKQCMNKNNFKRKLDQTMFIVQKLCFMKRPINHPNL